MVSLPSETLFNCKSVHSRVFFCDFDIVLSAKCNVLCTLCAIFYVFDFDFERCNVLWAICAISYVCDFDNVLCALCEIRAICAMWIILYVWFWQCNVLFALCAMCCVCDFDIVQNAMFFVLYVQYVLFVLYVQYVQYALCLTLTAGLKTDWHCCTLGFSTSVQSVVKRVSISNKFFFPIWKSIFKGFTGGRNCWVLQSKVRYHEAVGNWVFGQAQSTICC